MNRWSTTARAAAPLASLVLVLAACGDDGRDDPAIEPTTTATTVVVDLGSGGGSVGADGAATALGPLPAGTYTTAQLSPELTFTVPDGWDLAYENADEISLVLGLDDGSATVVNVLDVTGNGAGVLEPGVGDEGVMNGAVAGAAVGMELLPFPEDYEAYLRAQPGVTVGPRRPVEIGGAAGFALDLDLSTLPPGTCSGVGPALCFSPAATTTGPVFVAATSRFVIHVLDVGGATVLVMIADPQLRPGAAEAVLASMRWDGV